MRTASTLLDHYNNQVASEAPKATLHHSPWHSPVVYLFGGLAAVLGLIAFALLVLACSYFKHADNDNTDVEGGAVVKEQSSSSVRTLQAFDQKFLVIMAGEIKPTFLATPIPITSSNHEKALYNKEKDEEAIKRLCVKVQTAEQTGEES